MMKNKNKKRRICIVTGSRAEYGLLSSTMKAIAKNSKLDLAIVACGMHLESEFGSTFQEINKDGFNINATVKMTPVDDSAESMAKSVGVGILGLVDAFKKIKPDVVLVLGDRVEAFASSIASVYSNIPVAHIHGGDKNRNVDEVIRHTITKLAHIHFPATENSRKRIIKMGEEKDRVFMVGAPGLDFIQDEKLISPDEIFKKYNLNPAEPAILVIQHPVTTELKMAGKQMEETLKALVFLGYQSVIIYPNADAGGRAMIKVLEKYTAKYPFLKTYKSIPRTDYLSLMNLVNVMAGNSSSGIIETSVFHLPVVNIGIRQKGRERSSNVIDVPHDRRKIVTAIRKCIFDKTYLRKVKNCRNPYGKGGTGEKIARILSNFSLTPNLLKKAITY
ncbi:MAG: UDP-N-acetylglucosamine 2-epimerase [Parcubacteria group bacterium Licking1014_17]|nr:MAG: UDP-N-acetylglucosamine 2-epimerase [Parcubacteria group bacterium Licking1014_17]